MWRFNYCYLDSISEWLPIHWPMAISLRQRRATRYRFLPPRTRNAFFYTDCSWLENRATGLKNLGWEPLTSRKCPPMPFPPYRDVLLLRHANEECFMRRRISFLTFYVCVCAVCYRFFMSYVTGIKVYDSAHASIRIGSSPLRVQKRTNRLFSLPRVCQSLFKL